MPCVERIHVSCAQIFHLPFLSTSNSESSARPWLEARNLYHLVYLIYHICYLKLAKLFSPLDIEDDPLDPGRAWCKCYRSAAGDPVSLLRGSVKKHLESNEHHTSLQEQADRERLRAAATARLNQMSQAPTTNPRPSLVDRARASRLQMFAGTSSQTGNPGMNTMEHSTPEDGPSTIHDNLYGEPLIPVFMEPSTNDPAAKRQHLQDQFMAMLRQAEHCDEFCYDLS